MPCPFLGPAWCVPCRSSAESASVCSISSRPIWSSLSSSRAVGPETPDGRDHCPCPSPKTGAATPASPTSSSSRVTAKPRVRTCARSTSRSPRLRRVWPVGVSSRPVGAASTSQASSTLPRAEQCGGTSMSVQSRAPSRKVESTWAMCATRPPLATARCTVSPVLSPIALEHRPRQPGQLLVAVVPGGVEHEQRAADVLPGRGALQQPVALQRREQPRGGRAGQARRPRSASAKVTGWSASTT